MAKQKRTRKVSYSIDAILVRRPEVVLREAIEKGNWFEGVALSTVYLESATFDRLRKYLANREVRARPFLKYFRLGRLAEILEKLGLIDHKTHSLIGEVNKYRNNIVHEIRTPDAINPHEAREIIEKALKCLEAIASSYETGKCVHTK